MPRLLHRKLIEDDPPPIGRPLRRSGADAGLGVRDAAEVCAVCSNHIDGQFLNVLPGALASPPFRVAIGGKGKPLAIWRPPRPEEAAGLVWITLYSTLPGQIAELLRLEIENPDVGLVRVACRNECHQCSIWR